MNDNERQVHTTPEEGHPAGDGERGDREIGGPTSPEDPGEGDTSGGAPGTKPADEQPEPHE